MKMQSKIKNEIRKVIEDEESNFQELQGGSFVRLDTGEILTKTEHDVIIKRKLEDYKVKIFAETNHVANAEYGIENEQVLLNKRSKPKKKNSKLRERYDNGDFNIVYREKIEEVIRMKLTPNEKLVFYVLRDFVQYPTNCIVIKDKIPTIKELEPIVGLSNRSIISALKSLEGKGMMRRVQVGHSKAIYINPEYYASGKDLAIETLKIFNILDYSEEKVESYI